MQIPKPLKPILYTTILFIINAIIFNFPTAKYGGEETLNLPFPAKVTHCGSMPDTWENCTYPIIWDGLYGNIALWLGIFAIITLYFYLITRKK